MIAATTALFGSWDQAYVRAEELRAQLRADDERRG